LPGELPLDDETRSRLERISPTLAEMLVVDDMLLNLMRSRHALSESDYQRLKADGIDYSRNLKMVQVLLRGSDMILQEFKDALERTNQSHVKDLIEHGKGQFCVEGLKDIGSLEDTMSFHFPLSIFRFVTMIFH
jgi:hypothetical protein